MAVPRQTRGRRLEEEWMRRLSALVAAGWMLLAGGGPALAHRRNFTFTYDWFTPAQGEKEVELTWTQGPGGNLDAALEFEYGVTPRYVIAPYLLLKRGHGADLKVNGFQLEQRYRFGNFKERRLLPALYLEVNKLNGEPWELEGKFITSYVFDRYIWSFNAILAQQLEGGVPLSWEYSTGVARYLKGGVYGPATWVGLEVFGSLTGDEHRIGPVVGHSFSKQDHLSLTGGIGLNRKSDPQVRLIFEHEWF
jgi:hypothetical protein